jgi:hypothetical protein
MPIQSTKTGYIAFPDGGKVSVDDGTGWYDIGAINSAVNFTLNYTENQVNTANAGKLSKQIRDMLIDGSLTLINLEPDAIDKMGGGMFETVATAGTEVLDAAFTDQVFTGFTDMKPVPLEAVVTATSEPIRFSATPVLTSVDANLSGTLADGVDYYIIEDSNSASGYSIVLDTAGTATVATTETITIDFGDNTPLAGTTIYAGTSALVLSAYGLKVDHTDSDDDIDRSFEIYSANPTSGGFQFNFKGANEDGVEEMPITFQGDVDISRADGRQLFSYYIKG